MRDDIVKLICEKARKPDGNLESSFILLHHNRLKNGKFNRRFECDYEDFENFEILEWQWDCSQQSSPMNRHAKMLSDHLGAMKGWARKQVGRNWNDVMSEFFAQIKRKSRLQDHVYSHVSDFIYLPQNVIFIEGKAYGKRFKKTSFKLILDGHLYVDPSDNIVKWGKEERNSSENSKFNKQALLRGVKIDSLSDDDFFKNRTIAGRSFRKLNDSGDWIEIIRLRNWKFSKNKSTNTELPRFLEVPVDERTKKRYKLN